MKTETAENCLIKLIHTAIGLEKKSIEFYSKNLEFTSDYKVRLFLSQLIEQEKRHLEKIKEVFAYIFPEKKNNEINYLVARNISEYYNPKSIKISDIQELVKYAVEEENITIKFYEEFKQSVKNKNYDFKLLRIIDSLISEERDHLKVLAEITIETVSRAEKIINHRNIIFFDLDGTLITYGKDNEPVLRPNLYYILDFLYREYVLCIYSKNYFNFIHDTLSKLNLQKYFCLYFDNSYTVDNCKDLRYILNRINLPQDIFLKKMILIDDSFEVYPKKNHIKVIEFTGQYNDKLFADEFLDKIKQKFVELQNEKD